MFVMLDVAGVAAEITRTPEQVTALVAARKAWTARHPVRTPPAWLIPAPTPDPTRGWVWPQSQLVAWSIRMGWHTRARCEVPLIGLTGIAYLMRVTEQALRKLQRLRALQIETTGAPDVGAMPGPVAYLPHGSAVRVVWLDGAPRPPGRYEPLLFGRAATEKWMLATRRVVRAPGGQLVANRDRRGGLKRAGSDFDD